MEENTNYDMRARYLLDDNFSGFYLDGSVRPDCNFCGCAIFSCGSFFSVLRVRFLWGTFPVEYSRGRLCLSNVC